MTIPPLVSTEWLAANLTNPELRILDASTYLSPRPVGHSIVTSGIDDYLKAHIPGAQHVTVTPDLAEPASFSPFLLPTPEKAAAFLGAKGISSDHHVIVYVRKQMMIGTRAWFILKTLGAKVSLLDGGFEKWESEGRPVTTEIPTFPPATFTPSFQLSRVASAEDVAAAIENNSAVVVNALTEPQFKGTAGPHYGRPGRIPGSLNVPFPSLLTAPALLEFKPVDDIRAAFAQIGLTDPKQPVINYCGGAIAATVTAFGLEVLGFENVKVYDGSLLEWSNDPAREMVKDGLHESEV